MKLLERWLGRRRAAEPAHVKRGREGELAAYRHLRKLGYTVVARNYRPRDRSGEIDLVAWDGPTLAFIEVKTRSSEDFGSPESAVDGEKRRRLIRAAGDYLRRARLDPGCARFDVVSVIWGPAVEIRLEKDAFAMRETAKFGRLY